MNRARLVFAAGAIVALPACTHIEVWEGADYVHPGSVEYTRLAERLDQLYVMTCGKAASRDRPAYIINGSRVVLMVPDDKDCETAIPYAICYARADQDPRKLCRRIERRAS